MSWRLTKISEKIQFKDINEVEGKGIRNFSPYCPKKVGVNRSIIIGVLKDRGLDYLQRVQRKKLIDNSNSSENFGNDIQEAHYEDRKYLIIPLKQTGITFFQQKDLCIEYNQVFLLNDRNLDLDLKEFRSLERSDGLFFSWIALLSTQDKVIQLYKACPDNFPNKLCQYRGDRRKGKQEWRKLHSYLYKLIEENVMKNFIQKNEVDLQQELGNIERKEVKKYIQLKFKSLIDFPKKIPQIIGVSTEEVKNTLKLCFGDLSVFPFDIVKISSEVGENKKVEVKDLWSYFGLFYMYPNERNILFLQFPEYYPFVSHHTSEKKINLTSTRSKCKANAQKRMREEFNEHNDCDLSFKKSNKEIKKLFESYLNKQRENIFKNSLKELSEQGFKFDYELWISKNKFVEFLKFRDFIKNSKSEFWIEMAKTNVSNTMKLFKLKVCESIGLLIMRPLTIYYHCCVFLNMKDYNDFLKKKINEEYYGNMPFGRRPYIVLLKPIKDYPKATTSGYATDLSNKMMDIVLKGQENLKREKKFVRRYSKLIENLCCQLELSEVSVEKTLQKWTKKLGFVSRKVMEDCFNWIGKRIVSYHGDYFDIYSDKKIKLIKNFDIMQDEGSAENENGDRDTVMSEKIDID